MAVALKHGIGCWAQFILFEVLVDVLSIWNRVSDLAKFGHLRPDYG